MKILFGSSNVSRSFIPQDSCAQLTLLGSLFLPFLPSLLSPSGICSNSISYRSFWLQTAFDFPVICFHGKYFFSFIIHFNYIFIFMMIGLCLFLLLNSKLHVFVPHLILSLILSIMLSITVTQILSEWRNWHYRKPSYLHTARFLENCLS